MPHPGAAAGAECAVEWGTDGAGCLYARLRDGESAGTVRLLFDAASVVAIAAAAAGVPARLCWNPSHAWVEMWLPHATPCGVLVDTGGDGGGAVLRSAAFWCTPHCRDHLLLEQRQRGAARAC
eukprot:gene8067-59152_t